MQDDVTTCLDLKVSLDEAKSYIGKIVKVDKKHREFVSRLIAVEGNNVLVFQTKSGKIIRDPLASIILMQEVG